MVFLNLFIAKYIKSSVNAIQYSNKYKNGWNDPQKSVYWPKSTLPNLYKTGGITLYARMDFTFEKEDITAYVLKVYYLSGLIIYADGKEIYRNNMPSYIYI